MRTIAVVCAVYCGVGCGSTGPAPAGALVGPARAATAGRGERCELAALEQRIATARLRGHLGRLGKARFELAGEAIDGGGGTADDAVPVLAEDGDRVQIAVHGQAVVLVMWIDRADLSPVTLVEHRVSSDPGLPPPADELGLTVFPGHPVERETRDGWVRVRGHGLFGFDGWIPDDTGELWESDAPAQPETDGVWIERGSSITDDPGGHGRVLASVRRSVSHAHLLESNALGADKVELVDTDARLVGYAMRPPPMHRLGPAETSDMSLEDHRGGQFHHHDCLYAQPGGAVVGVVDGPLVDVEGSDQPGWGLTPVATPWGDVVLSLRTARTTGRHPSPSIDSPAVW